MPIKNISIMNTFSHLDSEGKPRMVDVGNKQVTRRSAVARAVVRLPAEVLRHIRDGDIRTAKGSVFQTAIIAGVMAAKKTGDLIPLCHPLPIEHADIRISLENENEVIIESTASIEARTGVEMEALTGATVAALTVYDMCKAMSHQIVISEIKLLSKTGGKSDYKYE